MYCAGSSGRWAFGCNSLYFIPLHTLVRIHMRRWCLYTIPPLGRTLCTNRRDWTPGNWWLYRRTYSPLGTSCSQCPYNSPQQRRIQTGMKWTGRRQLRTPAQLPEPIQLFFSSSPPLVRKRTEQRRPKVGVALDVDRTELRARLGAKTGRRVRVAEHPARYGGACHFTPTVFIIITC